jgi:hypothetical protein
MQERRFNFVRRKSALKFNFVARETRVASGHALPRGFTAAARGFLLSAAVFAVFVFSANLLVRYAFEKLDVKGFSLDISPFAKPRYFISRGNMYVVFSNGRVELVDRNMDGVSLPFISGVDTDEKRKEHRKALKMAIGLNPEFLENISEINLANPENIIIITLDGRKIYAGDSINNEKMENYHIALDRITRNYSTVDLRYRDRVIIK